MNWALVIMMCSRFCYPQYVEVYQTREQCQQQMKAPNKWSQDTHYCAPIAKKD